MKILKRLIIALVILGLIFAAIGFGTSKFINKEMVEKQVSAATGREFKIEGDLQPVFSLNPSIRAEGVTLANAKWGSRPALATIGKFNIQMQLLPLLQKKIVVDKLELDNADILLEQKNNQWNFAFEQTTANAEVEKNKPAAEKKSLSFDISALNITNSKLIVNQSAAPLTVSVKLLKLAPHDKLMSVDFEGVVNNKPIKLSAELPPVHELLSGQKIDVANLSVVSEDMKIKANVQIDAAAKKITINSLDASKGDLSLTGKGWADINSKKVELVSFTAKKGDLKFSGAITADARGKKPYIQGTLATDLIEMKAAPKVANAPPAAPAGNKTSPDEKLPLDVLDAANADVKLSIGKLVSGNIVLDKITAAIKLNNGILTISPLNANFANGQIAAGITLSRSGVRVNLKASNLLMEKILEQTANNNDFKNGITNADISLSGSGDSISSLENSLSGTSKLTMKEGTYSGQILKGRASQLTSLLTGNDSRVVDINCAAADINWAAGTGSLQQMGVDTKYANVSGTGQIRLAGEGLNLVLTPVSKLPALNSLSVPIAVRGTFNDPEPLPMTQKVVQNVLGNLLEAQQGGKKFNLKSALGVQKGATITSPCGAAPATVPAAANNNTAPATNAQNPAAEQMQQPAQPLSKQEKKAQKIQAIDAGLKQLGF